MASKFIKKANKYLQNTSAFTYLYERLMGHYFRPCLHGGLVLWLVIKNTGHLYSLFVHSTDRSNSAALRNTNRREEEVVC